MKYFLIILLFFCFSLTGCGNNSTDNPKQNNDYTASRITATDNEADVNNTTNSNTDNIDSNITIDNNTINAINTESELSSFSTKIYTPNDEARQTNIKITCSKLDGTVINSRRDIFFL